MADDLSDAGRGGNWDVVSEAIGRTMEAKLPLPATLRALATDLADRKSAALLKRIAARIERGESLESIFSPSQSRKPLMTRLLYAVSLTSQPAEMMSRFVGLLDNYIHALRNMRVFIAYPLICLTLSLFGVFVLMISWLIPATSVVADIVSEFAFDSSGLVGFQLLVAGVLVSFLVGLCIWVVGFVVVLCPVRASRYSLIYYLPILGRYYGYLNLAMAARLMELLTQAEVGISKSLAAAAMLVHWPKLRRVLNDAAQRTSESSSLEEVVANDHRFPATLRTFLTQSGNKLSLSSRFAAAGDFFEQQADHLGHAMRLLLFPFIIFGLLLVWVCYAIPVLSYISWIRLLTG